MDPTRPTVLVAVDLENARDTIHHAAPWIERLGGSAEVLHVDTLGAARGRTRTLLESMSRSLPMPCRGPVTIVENPRVADEIVARAASASLVIVGNPRGRNLAQSWLGAVAERVVRSSPVPVLVLHGEPDVSRSVLVAVDLAHQPDALIAAAGEWAARLGSTVHAVHAAAPPSPSPASDGTVGHPGVDALRDVHMAREARLRALMADLPEHVRGTCEVEVGEASSVVTARAAHGLIIVGTHRRTGPGRFCLGSVAERIARRSTAPVLVVPLGG